LPGVPVFIGLRLALPGIVNTDGCRFAEE
jgi:hypothetical protein